MRIAVVGAGGVGGYFGGRLAEAGNEVVFVARGAHLAAMRDRGLRLKSIAGDAHIKHVTATDAPDAVGPVDAVLVATKAWQVAHAASQVEALVGPDTLVVGLQNGIEAADELSAVFGAGRVAGGSCAIISFVEEPGVIRHAGAAPRIVVGPLRSATRERCAALIDAFAATRGVKAVLADDVRVAIWRKFLFIAPTSGLGAVTRAPLGVLRTLPGTRRMLRAAMQEVWALAAAEEVVLPDDAVDQALAFVHALPAEATTSMQRDIVAGRPSELEAQSGAVVRRAVKHGLEVPTHRMLYDALLPQERAARARRPNVSLLPFASSHFALLSEWLDEPAVRDTWGDPAEPLALAQNLPERYDHAVIVEGQRPVGYVRWARCDRALLKQVGAADLPEGVVDIDILLGAEASRGQGVGSCALELLAKRLFDEGAPALSLISSRRNHRAHRSFEKAGWVRDRPFDDATFGPCWLYLRRAPRD